MYRQVIINVRMIVINSAVNILQLIKQVCSNAEKIHKIIIICAKDWNRTHCSLKVLEIFNREKLYMDF